MDYRRKYAKPWILTWYKVFQLISYNLTRLTFFHSWLEELLQHVMLVRP